MKKRERKVKRIKNVMIGAIAFAIMTIGVFMYAKEEKSMAAVERRIYDLDVIYRGDAVEVGKKVDLKDIMVTGYFDTEGYKTEEILKSGYTVTPEIIEYSGSNVLTVAYGGLTQNIVVRGKTVEAIRASYPVSTLTVGDRVVKDKITLRVYYSDGSSQIVTDFILGETEVLYAGTNVFEVFYADVKDEFVVYGKAPLGVVSIDANYVGGPIIVSNQISKSDIRVYARYNDGTYKEVTNFTISPSTVTREETNYITVTFGGATDVVEVYGLEKEVKSFKVKYVGNDVVVGKTVNKNDIKVTATYNDGTTAETTDFTISGSFITEEGENIVVVYCGGYTDTIVVLGVIDFSYSFEKAYSEWIYGTRPDISSLVTVSMKDFRDEGDFKITKVEPAEVRNVVNRVFKTDEFLAYEFSYDNDDMMIDLPIGMRVTLPKPFEPDKFGIYFTTNRKTIMGKMNAELVVGTNDEYEFVAYRPGTYIVLKEVTRILVNDIEIDDKLTLKVGRNYSLSPIILPTNADMQDLSYASSNENVATVTDKGKIKAVAPGKCTIRLASQDGSQITKDIEITVKAR